MCGTQIRDLGSGICVCTHKKIYVFGWFHGGSFNIECVSHRCSIRRFVVRGFVPEIVGYRTLYFEYFGSSLSLHPGLQIPEQFE